MRCTMYLHILLQTCTGVVMKSILIRLITEKKKQFKNTTNNLNAIKTI